jgi:large subunit ribosomal protein L22
MSKALLKNYRQSPRKVRLIADVVRGKKVNDALTTLRFMPKRSALPMQKLIESAFANAKDNSVPTENLIIKEITVDEGVTMKRWIPKWRGTAHPIRKRTSNVKVVLGEKADKKSKTKEENKTLVKSKDNGASPKVSKKAAKKAPANVKSKDNATSKKIATKKVAKKKVTKTKK